ncbi:MAG: hypothetical protein ACXVXD_05680 [Nocardioidaceae bacterium]
MPRRTLHRSLGAGAGIAALVAAGLVAASATTSSASAPVPPADHSAST